MTVPTPEVRIHAYEVTPSGVGPEEIRHSRLIVKHLTEDVWVVGEEGAHYFLNAEGEAGYQSSPDRRYDLKTAKRVAQDLVRRRLAEYLALITEREENR